MSEVKVNKISPRTNCGTVQLGDSGDTITIPAGATIVNNGTQTGFGRTGTVDWDTTAKTASFTAVSGNGYFVNTTSSTITLTLPASPSAGDIVAFKDYAFTFATNNLTVDGNGSPIGGVDGTQGPIYSTNGTSKTFIYVDGTKGWLATNESTDTSQESTPTYIVATGGTILTNGDFKTHVFTGPGTFTVCSVGCASGSNSVEYVVVAGGGGSAGDAGGGAGAGGMRLRTDCCSATPINAPAKLSVTATSFPITVGGGGSGGPSGNAAPPGTNGSSSVFSTITSAGGGYGGGFGPTPCAPVVGNGGSGGGAFRNNCAPGGSGNTPPVSPPQGKDGGSAPAPFGNDGYSAGGGGAENIGANASTPTPTNGKGGDGGYVPDTFFGPTAPSYGQSPTPLAPNGRYFSGGGTGGGNIGSCTVTVLGGAGGGGSGFLNGNPGVANGGSGGTNTGGGGGGGTNDGAGGAGGSGIVLIRYKYQ